MLRCRDGSKLSRPVYLAPPHSLGYQSKIILLILLINLSDCEDVSILNIIQITFSCFLCRIVPYT